MFSGLSVRFKEPVKEVQLEGFLFADSTRSY